MLITVKGENKIVQYFNTSKNTSNILMYRSSRQKINKEIQPLNETVHQVDLMDIYRTSQLKVTEYSIFSSAHGTFSKIDHILGHKSGLSQLNKIKILSSIFSDHRD